MERENFIQKFNIASTHVDDERVDSVINTSIEKLYTDTNFKGYNNLVIALEELSELQQAITKKLRGKEDLYNIIEEFSDVIICLKYIKYVCSISDDDIKKAINVKINEIERRLNNDEFN